MKKIFVLLSLFLSANIMFFACSSKPIDEQGARDMLENAIFSPEQAFDKYKAFSMKTERLMYASSSLDLYINELNKDSYNANSLYENKVVQDLYVSGNKLRLSCYVESISSPLELHIIYDGETLWCVSNFAQKDSRKITFEQAKAFICFPKSDFFRRIRADFEQSGKQIQYKYAGVQKYNRSKCNVVEMSLKEEPAKKAVFFIDKKTNIVVNTGWEGIFPSNAEVKKINNEEGIKYPSLIEMSYGQYFTAIMKYSVKINDYIHPDTFEEESILLPVRSAYKERRFQEEKVDRRRNRIRAVFDSVQSFEVVLQNMHLTGIEDALADFYENDVEGIILPVLENRLIPDNAAAYKIPLAADVQAEEERKLKEEAARKARETAKARAAAQAAKKAAEAKKAAQQQAAAEANDETDWLEYNPRDAYKVIEAELEELRESSPEEYLKMKLLIEEMKQKDERIRNLSN